ncbi:hypothetical protein [Fusobacterium periodonticum]|uniref:Apea-like HEPN domain-containing protein n=1 Tax=Fusobacterium periodonticum D10 TaxID=620833 RepID=K1GZA2_9FUSO|nr:hypothetical protein [Fusobacterium periodonticum]EKA94762.1 hypothetical protein FPOG_00852 [Fusobacterium periodonticum D10]
MNNVKEYFLNNQKMIELYEKLYEKEINISDIKNKLFTGYFDRWDVKDFSLFRIFLNGCMLLINKDLMKDKGFLHLADYYEKKVFNNKKDNRYTNYDYYISRIEKDFPNFKPINTFYKDKLNFQLSSEKKLNAIRNSFAHMQYGNFLFDRSGAILFFDIYNCEKERGKNTAEGIVFEPIFNELVENLFSNNPNKGISYNQSFFFNYLFKEEREVKDIVFYKIKYKKLNKIEMVRKASKELAEILNSRDILKIINYLKENKEKGIFDIEYKTIDELGFNFRNFEYFLKDKIIFFEEKWYLLKAFLDFNSELSNFIVHMRQLNENIMEYLINKKNAPLTEQKQIQIEKAINELDEDEKKSYNIFKIMFLYLKSFNICNIIENGIFNDTIRLDKIDIKGIKIKTRIDFLKFLLKEKGRKIKLSNKLKYLKKIYVLERFRNALVHGDNKRYIKINLNNKGEIIFTFLDEYEDKNNYSLGIIEIEAKNLNEFISQEAFFE